MRNLIFALAGLVGFFTFTPARAQAVPSQAQCETRKAEAIAWRRAVFKARVAEMGRLWLEPGPDDGLWGEAGVQAMACLMARSTSSTSPDVAALADAKRQGRAEMRTEILSRIAATAP